MLKSVRIPLAAFGVLIAAPAFAAPVAPSAESFGVSAFALPAADLAQGLAPEVDAVGFAPARPRTSYEATRYRPRSQRSSYGRRSSAYGAPFQIHAGFFELGEEPAPTSFVIGMRGGPNLDPHVQLAFGLDWMHNSERSRTVTGEPYEQGGVIIVPERELSRASSDIVPITANLQVNLSRSGPLIPYVGAGGGWQVLFLSAEDYATGEDYDATFGGWTWQLFGGAQLELSGQARLVGEVFFNQGEAEREVEDLAGFAYREIVDLDGAGMRFGLSWGF